MQFRPCKALLCLVFSLLACGEKKDLSLEYTYAGQAALDLILVAGLPEDSEDLRWSADISGLPGFADYRASEFADLLALCARHLDEAEEEDFELSGDLNDCLDLGKSLGEGLFGNEEIQLEDPISGLEPQLSLKDETYLFVLFFYNAGNTSGSPRCVELKMAKRIGSEFQTKSRPLSKTIQIDLNQPTLNLDCFPL